MNRDYERRRDLLLLHADSPPPWTPAALSPSLWLGAYEEARGTKNTQPVVTNPGFDGAAGWTTPGTWSIGGGVATVAPGVVSNLYQETTGFVVGNRYATQYTITALTAGQLKFCTGSTGGATFRGAAGTYAEELEAKGDTWLYIVNALNTSASVDNVSASNLSITSYTPRIGAALTQATATAMPWSAALGMMFDGDLLPWGGAADAKCMHTGDGGSLGWQYRPTTLKAENRIVATAATAVGNVGVTVSCTNANTVRVRVMNGGAAYDYDSGDVACAIAINTTYTMVLRVATGAGGVSLRVNGVEVISGALTAPSAANATTGLMFGGDAAGAASNVTGYIGKGLLVTRALTVAECAQFEAYCAGGATL